MCLLLVSGGGSDATRILPTYPFMPSALCCNSSDDIFDSWNVVLKVRTCLKLAQCEIGE